MCQAHPELRVVLTTSTHPVYLLADVTPGLARLWPDCREFYDLWLVMHGDLHRTARVRAVGDAIVEVFEDDTEPAAARSRKNDGR